MYHNVFFFFCKKFKLPRQFGFLTKVNCYTMKKKKEILISESLLFAAVVESFFAFDSRFDTKLFSNLMKFGFCNPPSMASFTK